MVDEADSKSVGVTLVWVRVPPPAPGKGTREGAFFNEKNPLRDLLGLFRLHNSEMGTIIKNGGLSMIFTLAEIKSRVLPVIQKYNIPAMYLFGSYARGEATEESDAVLP